MNIDKIQYNVSSINVNNRTFKNSHHNLKTKTLNQATENDTYRGNNRAKTAIYSGLGIIAIASLVEVFGYKGKHFSKLLSKTTTNKTKEHLETEQPIKNTIEEFTQIGKFTKGNAVLNNGKNYTGIIEKNTQNGLITMEYSDGILTKSVRAGEKPFEKIYETLEDGSRKITITRNGKTETIVPNEIKQAIIKYNTPAKKIKKVDYIEEYNENGMPLYRVFNDGTKKQYFYNHKGIKIKTEWSDQDGGSVIHFFHNNGKKKKTISKSYNGYEEIEIFDTKEKMVQKIIKEINGNIDNYTDLKNNIWTGTRTKADGSVVKITYNPQNFTVEELK